MGIDPPNNTAKIDLRPDNGNYGQPESAYCWKRGAQVWVVENQSGGPEIFGRITAQHMPFQPNDRWHDPIEEEPPYKYSFKGQIDHTHRPWYPDGAVHVAEYSYETRDPFNGKRSQKIVIPLATVSAGIAQDGYYLKAGIHYRLRLHAKGTGEIRGRAMLRDSEGSIAQALLGSLDSSWESVEVMLGAARSSPDATLALEFEGPGTVWLDRIYLIGDDAVLGLWRPDVVEALRKLQPGVIRFGGTSVEGYEWEQTIGGWDSRVPFTTYWGGLELNFVGLDEFVQLCRHVGAEPLICVRWTGKSPADAAAEVEYLNGAANTRWGSMRVRNGHAEPYGVKYWQIGNEVGLGPCWWRVPLLPGS